MTQTLTPPPLGRSQMMARVHSSNTKPEIEVRKALHASGLRFRLHSRDLPGKPDIVFPSRKLVVFVHGCFWHQHSGCKRARMPKENADFWTPKLQRNLNRDQEVQDALRALGWVVLVAWECKIKSAAYLTEIAAQIASCPRVVRSATRS